MAADFTRRSSFAPALGWPTGVLFLEGGVVVEQGSAEQVFTSAREARTRQFLQQIMHWRHVGLGPLRVHLPQPGGRPEALAGHRGRISVTVLITARP